MSNPSESRQLSLSAWIGHETRKPHPTGTQAFLEAIHTRWPTGVGAVIFYGSCRRSQHPEGLYDLYVILDNTQDLPPVERVLLTVLPPNVYYLEVSDPVSGQTLRSKTTLIPLHRFQRGMNWFHSYLWARFCQPVTLVYTRNEHLEQAIQHILEAAVCSFIRHALPLLPQQFDVETLWITGLRASYRAELRSEGPQRANVIFDNDPDYYRGITGELSGRLSYSHSTGTGRYENRLKPVQRTLGRLGWVVRIGFGKLLSLARILKGWVTFEGGLDYIVWKLERHSGQSIEIPSRVRRRPLVYLWPFFWQLYKQGIFR